MVSAIADRPGVRLSSFVIALALVAAAWGAFRWAGASRDAAAAAEWARHLDDEGARAAFEKSRDTLVDHLVNPRLSLIRNNRQRREVTERAVAARSRMDELAGQPHGPDFRLRYRQEFAHECERIAGAVRDELARKHAQFGPLLPPQVAPQSGIHAARRSVRARAR